MQRLSDDLIGYMRTIEIAGVDVVQARRHGLAQKRDRTGNIARRAPHELVAILSGELHRPVTHPIQSQKSTRERKAAADIVFFSHPVFPPFVSLAGSGPANSSRKTQKDSPTSSSLFFQSAAALCGSSAYSRTPSPA